MTGILYFESAHGLVAFEVDESVARAAGAETASGGLTPKGVEPLGAERDGEVAAKSAKRFDEAMDTLRAYAANVQDLVSKLDLTPKEVSVEVGLKLSGTAGFIIAKAGAETEMKVALTWEPKPNAAETA